MLRNAKSEDSADIADIYNHYIAETTVTFETSQVTPDEMRVRIQETHDQELPYLVYEDQSSAIIGYAYASKWKGRCAYRYSVETSVYLRPGHGGQGLGTELYRELFKRLEKLGYHAAIGGISLPNPASIGLHEKFGMTKVAHFREIGFKFGKWVDVGYWQGLLKSPGDNS